jgi:hypothetical protein
MTSPPAPPAAQQLQHEASFDFTSASNICSCFVFVKSFAFGDPSCLQHGSLENWVRFAKSDVVDQPPSQNHMHSLPKSPQVVTLFALAAKLLARQEGCAKQRQR